MDRADANFVDILLGKTAAGRDPARWRTPVVSHAHRTLTKQDVFNYYSQPSIREALMLQLRAGPAIVVQNFGGGPTLRRLISPGGPDIRITQDAGEVDDAQDYQYWIERRAVEFHPVLGRRTTSSSTWILRTGSLRPTRNARRAPSTTPSMITPPFNPSSCASPAGTAFTSSERSAETSTSTTRVASRAPRSRRSQPLTKLKLDVAEPGQIRLDTSTLKQAGSLRGLYSLNQNTGLVCIPVEEEHLSDFHPEHATIRSVLGYVPRNARSLRP